MDKSGPAFPSPNYICDSARIDKDAFQRMGSTQGMTLRDYFAAHAPEPPEWYMQEATGELGIPMWTAFYKWRWEYADAMLAARKE